MAVDIRRIDLRLLVVFEAVMAERNVTRAANRIGMTQPAVSNALNRLRHLLRDPLFLRGPHGMRPTPRAVELSVPVGAALRQLQLAIEPVEFDPSVAQRSFRLAMSAHAAEVILPQFIGQLSVTAPGIELHIVPKSNSSVTELLDSNQVDFAIGVMSRIPNRFKRLTLFEDRYVAVFRSGHRLARDRFSMSDFLRERHVMVNPTGQSAIRIDSDLGKRNLHRNVVHTVNQLLVGAMIVAKTDLVAATFKRSLEVIAEQLPVGLVWRELDIEPVRVDLVWHPGFSEHPAHAWLRNQLLEVGRGSAPVAITGTAA